MKGYARKGKAQFGMKDYKAAFEAYLKGYELDNNNQEILHGLQKTREKLDGNMDEETVMRNIERDPVVQVFETFSASLFHVPSPRVGIRVG